MHRVNPDSTRCVCAGCEREGEVKMGEAALRQTWCVCGPKAHGPYLAAPGHTAEWTYDDETGGSDES